MLLVIDVGNTNITLGVFNKDELFGTFRMKTKQPRTSDEYGITLQELVERHGIERSKINAVILAYGDPLCKCRKLWYANYIKCTGNNQSARGHNDGEQIG